LVRVGIRADSQELDLSDAAGDRATAAAERFAVDAPAAVAAEAVNVETATGSFALEIAAESDPGADSAGLSPLEPGFSDIEAAVALVESGLATRVILTGFPSWPGLLWQAYQLAEAANVLILPTVVRPGGRVDIVIARDTRPNE
jgi:hypothetical protein